MNKAHEMRRAKRDEARKRINDIAAQYDRVLEVEINRQVAKDMMLIHASEKKDGEGGEGENEEADIDGELSKIERNEDRENELERISELEKMPLALEPPNVLVDLPSASSARRSGNFFNFYSSSPDKNEDDGKNNYSFGTFLSFVFVVIVFVVFAVVRRRRRKKILLAANRAYAEGRSFIV